MKTFKALVKETYIYEIEIEADTKEQALKKVKEIYDNVVLDTESEYRFTADANSRAKISAEPVKHGKWIEGGMFDKHDIKYGRHNYVCNRCKRYALYFVGGSENWWCSSKPSYCPNCGANMYKESEEN